MIELKKVDSKDEIKLKKLMKEVFENLERKEFFIPFKEEEFYMLFDESKILTYGAYDGDKLIGSAQLFLDEMFISTSRRLAKIEGEKVAMLGGYVVDKEYRNMGIIKKLQSILIQEAISKNYKYLTATAHPDNIASNKAIQSTGAKVIITTTLGEYLRNVYLLELDNISL